MSGDLGKGDEETNQSLEYLRNTTKRHDGNRAIIGRDPAGSHRARRPETGQIGKTASSIKNDRWWLGVVSAPSRCALSTALFAGSRADDSAPFEMSVENALKLLGVSEGASFEDILLAKNSIIAAFKGDKEMISQVVLTFGFFQFCEFCKATVITIGGLVAGAAVGSVVENWLQVDIVRFLGIHSPAVVVSEFILFSQFLVSLYLR
ncbi:uncharacterized protein LOC130781402 [Actinidia eriantha]|uniref:uncharacterized protein LOC130781402 n=1 Tax=Actinidia eriantha TaxID=165200 RepID=UPI0025864451|nr:uncharacterized protein LOC130781402 [Actinidia eriantha]